MVVGTGNTLVFYGNNGDPLERRAHCTSEMIGLRWRFAGTVYRRRSASTVSVTQRLLFANGDLFVDDGDQLVLRSDDGDQLVLRSDDDNLLVLHSFVH